MHRRSFLSASAQTVLASLLFSSCRSMPGPYEAKSKKGSVFLALGGNDTSSIVRILNLDDMSFRDFNLPLRVPHSIMRGVSNPDEIFAFEFFGSAVKLNQKTGAVTRIEGSKESLFHGHSVQSDDGKILWCTEHLSSNNDIVRARYAEDLSLVGNESTFSGGHHVIKLAGSSIFVSGGADSEGTKTLSFFDTKELKIIQKLPMKEVMGHLAAISPTEIIGVSNAVKSTSNTELDLTMEAPMVYANTKGELKTYWDEQRKHLFKFGFGLVVIPGSQRYLTSHHHSDSVILWEGFNMIKVFEVPKPLNLQLTRDGEEFVVLSRAGLQIYSLKSLERVQSVRYERPILVLSAYA